MSEQIPIVYRDFYDVPRMFVARFRGTQFLFDGSFDDDLDDYPSAYTVYALPAQLSAGESEADWSNLHARATRKVGAVPVSGVRFDPTRRASIDSDVLERLLDRSEANRGVA